MPKTIQTLSPEQSSKFVDFFIFDRQTIGCNLHCERNAVMILLMLDAGLRVGELVKLLVRDVWFDDSPSLGVAIPASITKTQSARTIPITERTRLAILKYSKSCSHFVFNELDRPLFGYGFPPHPISTRQVERIVRNVGQEVLGIRVHPHMLRHTFATRLMQKTNIRVVQALLGHQSLQSTQIYTHPNDQDLKKAIDSMQ